MAENGEPKKPGPQDRAASGRDDRESLRFVEQPRDGAVQGAYTGSREPHAWLNPQTQPDRQPQTSTPTEPPQPKDAADVTPRAPGEGDHPES